VYDTGTGALVRRAQVPDRYPHIAVPTDATVRVQYRADGGDTVTAELGLSDLRPTGRTGRRPFSPRTLVKYSADGAFEVVNGFGKFGVRPTIGTADGVVTRSRPPSRQAGMFTVSDDGQRVATGHDGTIHVLATTTAASRIPDSTVLTGFASVDALRFVTPDRLLSTSGAAVAVWDLAQISRITTPTVGYLVDRARYEQDPTVLPSPDGRLTVIADEVGHHAHVIDLDSGQQLYESPPFSDGDVVGTPLWTDSGARRVLTVTTDTVSWWEPADGRRTPLRWQSPADAGTPVAVARRGADELVAAYADGSVRIHSDDGGLRRDVAPAFQEVTCGPVVASDGSTVAVVGNRPAQVALIDVGTGRATTMPADATTCVQPASTRGIAVSYSDGSLRVVDGTGNQRYVPPVEADATIGWTVDSGLTLAGRMRSDGLLIVRDFASGRQLGELPVPKPASDIALDLNPYNSIRLAFRPGRAELLTVGSGAHLLRWDLDVERWLEIACRTAGRELSGDEWRRYTKSTSKPRSHCRH
jgi:hypothetical protein